MNAVILSCSNLAVYVKAAQETCGTDYPVVFLDQTNHVEPSRMRKHIIDTIAGLPEEYDTILVSMGYCGGSWQDISSSKRMVLPRVDGCVSLVMTTSDQFNPCTRQMGHMYVFGGESGGFSIKGIYDALVKERGEEMAGSEFEALFEGYRNVDIIDTGVYDCYDLDFVETVQADADRIHADIDYIPGSNLLLEKLVSGRWDRQFLVLEPGKPVTQSAIFDD